MTRSSDNSAASEGRGKPEDGPRARGGASCLAETGLCLGVAGAVSLVGVGRDAVGLLVLHVGLLLAGVAAVIAVVAVVHGLMARNRREGLLGAATLAACAAYGVLLPRAVDLRNLDHPMPSWMRRLLGPRASPPAPAGALRRGPAPRPGAAPHAAVIPRLRFGRDDGVLWDDAGPRLWRRGVPWASGPA